MRLKDKNIMIIGAGSDLGQAMIPALLEQGANLFLTSRNNLNIQKSKSVSSCIADPKNLNSMQEAAQRMTEQFGAIDAMIYLPGIIHHVPIDEMTEETWNDVLLVNLTGCFHACKAVVPFMKQKRSGRIILISSIGARTGRPVGCNYSASKAGMIGMTMSLAVELAPFGITVNCIAPGPLRGRLLDSMEPENRERVQKSILLGRIGEPNDVIPGIIYLASEEAAWITGEVLDINGGAFI